MNVTVILIGISALGTDPKGAGRVGNRSMSRDNPNYSIIEIGQNTDKSPSDLIFCLFGFYGTSPLLVFSSKSIFIEINCSISNN